MSEQIENLMDPKVDLGKTKAEARNAAEKRLREAFPEDFRTFMEQEHEKRGVAYKPRLTAEEKARADIERLAKEHGIRLAFDVTEPTDVKANVEVAQAAYQHEHASILEDTPEDEIEVVDYEDFARTQAAREALAQGPTY